MGFCLWNDMPVTTSGITFPESQFGIWGTHFGVLAGSGDLPQTTGPGAGTQESCCPSG